MGQITSNLPTDLAGSPQAGKIGFVSKPFWTIGETIMSCVHLKKLYELCSAEQLKISGADLVCFVCTQCGEQEVCPTRLMDMSETAADTEPPSKGIGAAAAQAPPEDRPS